MADDDERWTWHDQPGVTWAAGVAAVVLVGLLVVAVIRTASGSSVLPDFGPSAPAEVTSEFTQTTKTTSSATSYAPPSVQTTELDPSSAPSPTTDEPAPEEPGPSTGPSQWTPTNPYATTTTQNGGAV